MERVLEPSELMSEDEQARAYAEADFTTPHSNFIFQFSERFTDYDGGGLVLDLGCGPADITVRFAQRYPRATLHGVDGSEAMLKYGRLALERAGEAIASRITFIQGFIPGVALPAQAYDVVICNSLLHHLTDPQALWTTVKQHSRVGTRVFIGDLYRPPNLEMARHIMETYSGNEPDVLKRDYYNSLLAAFTQAEVEAQLVQAGLSYLTVETITDRHIIIYGVMA